MTTDHGPRTTDLSSSFGLIIIGNEILDGRREDAHFGAARALLDEYHLSLSYCLTLPDDPAVIEAQLRWAFSLGTPFFCCGGIGATPDDCTRHCAARAAGLPIQRHPEAEAILKETFGGTRCTELRMRMIDFPKGADLIPNPVNRVPGFRVANGHFLPGFPEMAGPMMRWVIDTWFGAAAERRAFALRLSECKEADLVPLMEAFIADNPDLSFSSLPMFTDTGTVLELGVRGPAPAAEKSIADLKTRLTAEGIAFREAPRT